MKKLISILISLTTFYYIITTVEFSILKKGLESISFLAAGLIIVTFFIGQVLSSIKWNLIINANITKISTFKYYFFGMFSNYFGLGTIGGDLARSLLLVTNHKLSKTKSFGSVLYDRIHGLAILAIIGIFFQILNPKFEIDFKLKFLPYLILVIIIATFIFIKLLPTKKFGKFEEKIINLKSSIPTLIPLIQISLLSVLSHCCQIVIHYFIAISLGLDIPIYIWFISVPIINIISSLPISWNGLGVREVAYFYMLSPNYITKEQSIIFGAIWLLANFANSMIGAIFSGELKLERNGK